MNLGNILCVSESYHFADTMTMLESLFGSHFASTSNCKHVNPLLVASSDISKDASTTAASSKVQPADRRNNMIALATADTLWYDTRTACIKMFSYMKK